MNTTSRSYQHNQSDIPDTRYSTVKLYRNELSDILNRYLPLQSHICDTLQSHVKLNISLKNVLLYCKVKLEETDMKTLEVKFADSFVTNFFYVTEQFPVSLN